MFPTAFGFHAGWEQPHWFALNGERRDTPVCYGRKHWHDIVGREVDTILNGVGVVDLSPFGKFELEGPGATKYLSSMVANTLPKVRSGTDKIQFNSTIEYSAVLKFQCKYLSKILSISLSLVLIVPSHLNHQCVPLQTKLTHTTLTQVGRVNISHMLTPKGKVMAELTISRLGKDRYYIVTGSGSELHDLRFVVVSLLQSFCLFEFSLLYF